jgi:hypothetical protein
LEEDTTSSSPDSASELVACDSLSLSKHLPLDRDILVVAMMWFKKTLLKNSQTDGRLQTFQSTIGIEKNDSGNYCKPLLVVKLAAACLCDSLFPHAF